MRLGVVTARSAVPRSGTAHVASPGLTVAVVSKAHVPKAPVDQKARGYCAQRHADCSGPSDDLAKSRASHMPLNAISSRQPVHILSGQGQHPTGLLAGTTTSHANNSVCRGLGVPRVTCGANQLSLTAARGVFGGRDAGTKAWEP